MPADALREQELAELESLRAKLLGVLNAAHPLVQAGVVAHDIVRDGQAALLLAVAQSRRALLGADAPKRLSLMDPAGSAEGGCQHGSEAPRSCPGCRAGAAAGAAC
jgi:hypothetical protein